MSDSFAVFDQLDTRTNMTQLACIFWLAAVWLTPGTADMYFQFPPGSNNRLNEETNARKNDNRLFDSQNNNRHGFNLNQYEFYVGSQIDLAWTLQHGCGENSNIECQTVIQYMCDGDIVELTGEKVNLQEGRTIDTVDPENANDPVTGQHEPSNYYKHCTARQRNYGLYTADQLNMRDKTKKSTARYSRQDNKGTRYGLECPEERDYYPYWHPSPWKDIAVLVDSPNMKMNDGDSTTVCQYYQQESENVKTRGFCKKSIPFLKNVDIKNDKFSIGNQPDQCPGEWRVSSSHNLPAPDCLKNKESKDNHHGNYISGRFFDHYQWTIPDDLANKECVIRLRYNMSTPELNNWKIDASDIINEGGQNRDRFDMPQNKIDRIFRRTDVNRLGPQEIFEKFGMSDKEAYRRNYRQVNDPQLYPMKDTPLRIEMSYNADQLGRVFEDRTYKIKFLPRPDNFPKHAKIHNLAATGKSGTDVEVYPNFNFDYWPPAINAEPGDYVHIQFSTDSRNNINNNMAITDELGGQSIRYSSQENNLPDVKGKNRVNFVPVKNFYSQTSDADTILNSNFLGLTSKPNQALKFNSVKNGQDMIVKLVTDGVYNGQQTEIYGKSQNDENYLDTSRDLKSYRIDHGLIRLFETGSWNFISTHNDQFGTKDMRGVIRVGGK